MTECQVPLELDDVGMQMLPREAIVTQLAVFLDERTRPSLSLIQLKALQVPTLPPRPSGPPSFSGGQADPEPARETCCP